MFNLHFSFPKSHTFKMFRAFVSNEAIFRRLRNAKDTATHPEPRDTPRTPRTFWTAPAKELQLRRETSRAGGGGAARHVAPRARARRRLRLRRGHWAGPRAPGRPVLRVPAAAPPAAALRLCGSDPGCGGREDATARVLEGRGPALPASG